MGDAMHQHYLEHHGETLDVVPFCSDACHRAWCLRHGEPYGGWNGCHEAENPEYCANCGVLCGAPLPCGCNAGVVVNRFLSEDGERCEHGGWLQIPADYVARMA